MNGRDYLVAPLTLIVPGVLNGSKGALYYPKDEIGKDPGVWNGVPIVVYHPTRNGLHVSARDPDVLDKQGIGVVMRSRAGDKLTAEGWFDVESTRRVDKRVLDSLEAGRLIELSTGLYTENEPTSGIYNGRSYDAIARNYKPDHLAILPDQVGACSVRDGCGVMVNAAQWQPVDNCGGLGGKPGPCPVSGAQAPKANSPTPTGKPVPSGNRITIKASALKKGMTVIHGGSYYETTGPAVKDNKPGLLIPVKNGWIRTGDKVQIANEEHMWQPTANCSCGGSCSTCSAPVKKKHTPTTDATPTKKRTAKVRSASDWQPLTNCGEFDEPATAEDGSLASTDMAVRRAFRAKYPTTYEPDTGMPLPTPHVVAVFPEYLIARDGDELRRHAWGMDDGVVDVEDAYEEVERVVRFEPVGNWCNAYGGTTCKGGSKVAKTKKQPGELSLTDFVKKSKKKNKGFGTFKRKHGKVTTVSDEDTGSFTIRGRGKALGIND